VPASKELRRDSAPVVAQVLEQGDSSDVT